MKARWVWLTGVKAFSIELTAILTANRLLSRAAEETDFLNGLLLTVHRRVDIQPQRCCNIRMTEHLAHALNVDPGFNAARCVGVTECVIAAFPDAAPAQNGLEVVLIGARLLLDRSRYKHPAADRQQLFSGMPAHPQAAAQCAWRIRFLVFGR